MSKKEKILIVSLIIILAATSRLAKHPYNFTPVVAMSLFAGFYLKKYWGVLIPLLGMLLSDSIIGFYDWQVMASVYLSIILAFYIAYFFSRIKWYKVIFLSLASSISFFIITNFAVWAFFDWYPHTWHGISACFIAALPFFRNTLTGDLIYSYILFGAYQAVLAFSDNKTKNILKQKGKTNQII
ncbi:DUF6580 family putative transport protein [Patescibacteria group bacterium]